MDGIVKYFVHMSCFLIFVECLLRVDFIMEYYGYFVHPSSYWDLGGQVILFFYIMCLVCSLLPELTKSKSVECKIFLTYLHGMDGVAAAIIGISMFYRSTFGLVIGMLIITKVFLLSRLNRMILGKTTDETDIFTELSHTSKSFIHHVGSFLFIDSSEELILTTCWRAISMSGHAMLVLRRSPHFTPQQIKQANWILAYIRILFVCFILYRCMTDVHVRESFGRSAVGHISYMSVRFGPVFQLGSIYLDTEEKEFWKDQTQMRKLELLFIEWKHIWLSVELSLLLFTSVYFAWLRVHAIFQ